MGVRTVFCGSDAYLIFSHFATEIDISQSIAGLLLAFLNDVAVNILSCRDLCMAQHFGYRDHIGTLRNQNGGCRVPESVRIDVG